MSRQFYTDKQKHKILRQIDEDLAQGMTQTKALKESGIMPATYYSWKHASAKQDGIPLESITVKRAYSPEEKDRLLSEIQKRRQEGSGLIKAIRAVGITDNTYYAWTRKAKSEPTHQIKVSRDLNGIKQLKIENGRLKELVAQLSLDKLSLQEYIAEKAL